MDDVKGFDAVLNLMSGRDKRISPAGKGQERREEPALLAWLQR